MASRSRQIAAVFARGWGRAAAESGFGLGGRAAWRESFARETRLAFEELGPAFIKLGQMMSVRPDVFSSELVFELSALQDSVAPVAFEKVIGVVEDEFARPQEELFDEFEEEPIASASIAQVHRARLRADSPVAWGEPLRAGDVVAVKVLKPGVRSAIVGDLELARRLARRLGPVRPRESRTLAAFIVEFEHSLGRELDMREEGRTADRFAFDFRDDERVRVPRVAWDRTTRRVLTMEYLEGWRLSELDDATRAGVDAFGLAAHGANAFMRQVLVHGRYHADLHPANLFVTPDDEIAYLDFGIVGLVTPEQRSDIARVLAALVFRDPARALEHSARLGVNVPPEKRAALTKDLGELMDQTLADRRDVRHFGMGFLALLGEYRIEIPVGYGLLVKSLVTVEGVARALYPQIDIIETSRPFVTRLIAQEELTPARLAQRGPAAARAALRELLA
jgi:ubiquinone biosynthesis protein